MVDKFNAIGQDEFRLVFEAAPSGMIMVDKDGTIVLVNAQAATLFGYTREELVGQKIEQLVPMSFRDQNPKHRDEFAKKPHARALGHGRDLYGVRKDGSEIPVEIGLNPLTTEAGEFVLASVVDVTERHRAERALLSGKERQELILIVEDCPINQQVSQLYLDKLGFASHEASNGIEAVEAAANNHYGVILMDCQMPEMDGFAATAAIRQAEKLKNKHTPIIAMTAHAMSGDRERCLAAGMDDFLSKPVDPHNLQATLMKWLGETPQFVASERPVPVDLDAATVRYGASIEQIYKLFLEKTPRDVEALKMAVAASDIARTLDVAHGLKGACATMIAMPLHATCAELERAATTSNWTLSQGLVTRLEEEWAEARDYVLNYQRLAALGRKDC